MHINFKLTKGGLEIISPSNDVFGIVKHTETSEIAKKRIKSAYLIPAIILAAIIEIGILIVSILCIVNSRHTISVIVFALAVYWAWLIGNMLLKTKKQ